MDCSPRYNCEEDISPVAEREKVIEISQTYNEIFSLSFPVIFGFKNPGLQEFYFLLLQLQL